MADIFYNFGGAEIAAALSEHHVPVARWLTVTEDNFKVLVTNLGEVEVVLPANVAFTADAVRYELTKGTQKMNGETLLNVMKRGFSGEAALSFQAEAVAAVLRRHLTVQTVERGEDFFSEIINLMNGNITAFDYAEYGPAIVEFLSKAPEISVIS